MTSHTFLSNYFLRAKPFFVIAFLFSIFRLYTISSAQEAKIFEKITPYSCKIFTEENGLPENTVKDIIRCKDGYLWAATYEGVAKFDGSKFKVYDKKTIKKLKTNIIYDIEFDSAGSMWLGTNGGGITKFEKNGNSFTFSTENTALPSDVIRAMKFDRNGTLWIASDKGIVAVKDDKLLKINELYDIPSSTCYVDKQNRVWFSRPTGGALRYDKGKITENLAPEIKETVLSIAEDEKGRIWMSGKYGIYIYENDQIVQRITKTDGLETEFIRTLYFDESRKIMWIGAVGNEIYAYYKGKIKQILRNKTPLDAAVNCFAKDIEGNLWFGVYKNGLRQVVANPFINIDNERGITDEMIKVVATTDEGDIFLGTNNVGVYHFDPSGELSLLNKEKGLTSDNINSLFFDSKKRLWMGTYHAFLNCYDKGKIIQYGIEKGMTSDFVSAFAEDKNGKIFVGSYGFGLYYLENDRFHRYISPKGDSSLCAAVIRVMMFDEQNNLWLGTNEGLFCVDNSGEIQFFGREQGLSFNILVSLYQEKGDKGIWVGTRGGGLNYFLNGKFVKVFNTENGLFNDVVYWILEDKFGNFWMSCNKGIFSVRKKDLRDVLNGKKNSVSCNVYGRESGMKSVQCSGAFSQAGAHFLDKYMIFPTTGGAVIVNPDPKNFIIRPPVANIENIIYKQKSRSIDEKEQIFELDDPEEVAEVQFSALSFSHPEKVQFRYTLKGLNKGLINLGKTRVIYLSNLPYGEYELFVQASTDGIKWMGSAKKVIFRVPPPFWFNPLFWLSAALTIVLMVWLLVRWRINRLHKAKIHLEELVDKKTLELRKEKETVEQQYEELTQKSQVILQKNTIIEEQNHNLKDSLRYAKRIQEAILPTESNLQTYFPFSWLYYRPRDIVSGDFYWLSKKKLTFNGKEENWLFFAVGDCTGHGVPGALMTVMGSTMLSEIADDMVSPEHLHIGLSLLDSKIHAMLQKNKESDSRTNDGMDIALFAVNAEAKKLFFSSAKLPFFHVRNGFLTEIKGNRFPIGSSALYDDDKNFVTEEIDLEKGDQIFVLSDGFQDQFGGEYFKKFTKKRLKTRLTELCAVDFFEQKKTLKHNFEEWKGENEQTDDVIALSVRF